MVEKFTHKIVSTVDDKVVAVLVYDGDRKAGEVRFTLMSPKLKGGDVQVAWSVDWSKKRLSIVLEPLVPAMSGTCLAGCLIGAGASLARCILKAKNEDEVWACLDEHGGTTGIGVIGCVVGCL